VLNEGSFRASFPVFVVADVWPFPAIDSQTFLLCSNRLAKELHDEIAADEDTLDRDGTPASPRPVGRRSARDELVVVDLGSANGAAIVSAAVQTIVVRPGVRTVVPFGAEPRAESLARAGGSPLAGHSVLA
jgi:hypothetical protein